MKHFWNRTALLLLLVFAAGAPLAAAEITVFAAASLTDALKAVGTNYKRLSGDTLLFNFGASSILARQIREGAPADIFFSADEATMDDLEKRNLILKDTRKSRLSNTLVIVVAAERGALIDSPKDLASDRVQRLAVAEPRTVPAGVYARQYLEQQHLWAAVQSKVIPTANVRAALAAVESGNVEAGIVYKTDAAISRKVKVAYEVPRKTGPAISYPMAVVRETNQPEAAKRFLRYVASEDAAKVFEKFGFIVSR